MILTIELALIFLAILLLGFWGIVSGVLQARNKKLEDPVSPQELSRLAQPYRELIGEAVAIYKDLARQAEIASRSLKPELQGFVLRMALLLKLAYPKAEHGTKLKAYALQLSADSDQQASLNRSAQEVEEDLKEFLSQFKTLRSKLYQVLSEASQLASDLPLKQDLDETFVELSELEARFAKAKADSFGSE